GGRKRHNSNAFRFTPLVSIPKFVKTITLNIEFTISTSQRRAFRRRAPPLRRGKRPRPKFRNRRQRRTPARTPLRAMADRLGPETEFQRLRRTAPRRPLPAFVPLENPARFLPDGPPRLFK